MAPVPSPTRKTLILPADDSAIRAAAESLRGGGLVAFPTETVYGLGADACNGEAIARLYQAKGRPSFNPLIVHVADLSEAERIGNFNPGAARLARAFWPGPLTLVVPRTKACAVADLVSAGLDTVAIRIPAHPVAQAILHRFGGAVAAPSANISGHVSPTEASHVEADLEGRIDVIVDGGAVVVGIESTIIGCVGEPALLRPGGIPRGGIEAILGESLTTACDGGDRPAAPGMLTSHYAPRAHVRLNASDVAPDEALLAFGMPLLSGASNAAMVMNLSERGDVVEAAARLFGCLRRIDATEPRTIAVMAVPDEGLGEAINDRLRRAAAARE
ncbi:MAG: L-threonylcarbamoyladenylate synthase [Alphaproteobacteria bacterium]|nr:L-threonylcarbamoyladenylate synthase [Alphaproteobacteria bacterium]